MFWLDVWGAVVWVRRSTPTDIFWDIVGFWNLEKVREDESQNPIKTRSLQSEQSNIDICFLEENGVKEGSMADKPGSVTGYTSFLSSNLKIPLTCLQLHRTTGLLRVQESSRFKKMKPNKSLHICSLGPEIFL